MDRVFVSRKPSPKKNTFKQFIKGNSNRSKSISSDTATDYFPYAGGDGVDVYEFHPSHLSYEPAESMVDSNVQIEAQDPHIGQKLKRVLLRGSRYEIYDPLYEDSNNNESTNQVGAESAHSPGIPGSLVSSDSFTHGDTIHSSTVENRGEEDSSFSWLASDLPTSIETVIPFIRRIACSTVALKPVDAIADQIDGIEPFIAGLEVFVMMLVADVIARVVQFICRPAVFVATMIFYLI